MRTIYICSDTVTGIFSAIYDAWKAKKEEQNCGIALYGNLELELFSEYMEVKESGTKRKAVERLIKNHLGLQAYRDIYQAVLSDAPDKADAVFGAMSAAKKLQDSKKIMEHLSHPKVGRVFELSRRVGNEAHAHIEFLRFRELDTGILYAPVAPKCRILTCIAPHFEDRFPLENWLIHDKIHKEFAVHEAGKHWTLALEDALQHGIAAEEERFGRISVEEGMYSLLWKNFVSTIAIKERVNPNCQRNHLPLRYRPNMTEWEPLSGGNSR